MLLVPLNPSFSLKVGQELPRRRSTSRPCTRREVGDLTSTQGNSLFYVHSENAQSIVEAQRARDAAANPLDLFWVAHGQVSEPLSSENAFETLCSRVQDQEAREGDLGLEHVD